VGSKVTPFSYLSTKQGDKRRKKTLNLALADREQSVFATGNLPSKVVKTWKLDSRQDV